MRRAVSPIAGLFAWLALTVSADPFANFSTYALPGLVAGAGWSGRRPSIQRRRSSSRRPAAASLPARCGCRSPISTPIHPSHSGQSAVERGIRQFAPPSAPPGSRSRRPPLPTADASPSADWGSRMSTNIESLPLLQASIGVGSDEDLVITLGFYLSNGVTALSLAGISFPAAVTSLLTATTIATLSTAGDKSSFWAGRRTF